MTSGDYAKLDQIRADLNVLKSDVSKDFDKQSIFKLLTYCMPLDWA